MHPDDQQRGSLRLGQAVLTLSLRGTDAGVQLQVNGDELCGEEPRPEVKTAPF